MQLTILSLCVSLVSQTVWGLHFSLERDSDYDAVSIKPSQLGKLYWAIDKSVDNVSPNRTEDDTTKYSQTNDTTLRNEENISNQSTSNQPISSTHTTSASSSSSDTQNVENSTIAVSNGSHSTVFSSSESSVATNGGTSPETKSSNWTTPSSNETSVNTLTTDDDNEPEGVARGKPSTAESVNITTKPQTLYQKGLALLGDPYTLSILVPVTAGVVFATSIILTIATCRCIRRRCIRRRLRRKALPDSVKNLRPSDRARLLAESSDEEF